LADRPEHIAGLGNMGQIDFGLDLVRFAASGTRASGGSGLRFGACPKMGPHFLRFMVFKRTGMRLLLGDTDFRENVENSFTFDFQLPSQIVNSNLAHPPFLASACPAKSSY